MRKANKAQFIVIHGLSVACICLRKLATIANIQGFMGESRHQRVSKFRAKQQTDLAIRSGFLPPAVPMITALHIFTMDTERFYSHNLGLLFEYVFLMQNLNYRGILMDETQYFLNKIAQL